MRRDQQPWMGNNNRAMAIGRISDRKQKDGVSLDAQERAMAAYVEGHHLSMAHTARFQESAKKSKLRRQFHAAIEHALTEKIRHLVFYVWDRVTRNFTDSEMLEELIRDDEIVLHIASGHNVLWEGSDDSAFFMFDINIAQAKQDNRTRRTKTIGGMEEKALSGWFPGRAPDGYFNQVALDENGRPKKRGGTIGGPTEEGRRWLRREMELRLAGCSLDMIRRKCLDEGVVPSSKVATYHKSLVEKHLKNPFYAALERPHDGFKSRFFWRGKVYDGRHEPLFTAQEWRDLQASFGKRAAYRKTKHLGLFGQGPLRLRCADEQCGSLITYAPKINRHGLRYDYYRCANGKKVHEHEVNVQEGDILQQLGRAIGDIDISDDFAQAILESLGEVHHRASEAKSRELAKYRAERDELRVKQDRLYDRYDGGEIDRSMYERQLARLRQEDDRLLSVMDTAQRGIDAGVLSVSAKVVLELAKSAKNLWESRSDTEKRDFLAKLLWNPRLNGRTVEYDLKKPFEVLSRMRGVEKWRPLVVEFGMSLRGFRLAA